MPRLSVVVITRNEAGNVRAALQSVRWADELVVVDSGSTDDTLRIAREIADRVTARDWAGYGAQKNHATALPRTTGFCRSTPTSASRRPSRARFRRCCATSRRRAGTAFPA